jgi:hypothetical protein
MEFNLTKEQKLMAVDQAINQAQSALYQTLLHAGIDPDTFDPDTHTVPDGTAPYAPPLVISEILAKISTLTELKSSIENA